MTLADASSLVFTDEPSVLIFADRPRDRAAAATLARGVGARVIGEERLSDAMARLDRQIAVDSVLIELDAESGPEADWLLDWANRAARDGDAVALIAFPATEIDRVMAIVDEPRVILLCDAAPEERLVSLGLALAARRHVLNDHGMEAEAERLRRLSEEVARIAGALAEISSSTRSVADGTLRGRPAGDAEIRLEPHVVRAMIRLRRMRAQFFSAGLFADPAWDMMLDLMAARLENRAVAVSSLCIAAAVPPTTALRWIRTLTENGVFVRRADPEDGRRIFIQLSDSAAAAMTGFFEQAQMLGWRPELGF